MSPARPDPALELEQRASRGVRATLVAVLVSTVLAMIKVLAGILGQSYALIADGMESVLDVFSSLVVMGSLRIAARPADHNHPYGHGKAESMAAMVIAMSLLFAAVMLAVQSVREILDPQRSPQPFTLIVLVLVVVTKEFLAARLSRVGREIGASSLRADAWHHRSDALTSAAAFIGISIALIGGEQFRAADGWAALVACTIIAFNGFRMLGGAVAEVMDVAAPPEIEERIRSTALEVPGVTAVDKCLARKSGPNWLVDIHVMVDGQMTVVEGHVIAHHAKDALLGAGLGILDCLVHIEPAPPSLPPSPD